MASQSSTKESQELIYIGKEQITQEIALHSITQLKGLKFIDKNKITQEMAEAAVKNCVVFEINK